MNTKHFLRAVIAILTFVAAAPAGAQGCTGDLTGNGIVDGADLGTILAYWGPRTQDPTAIASDLNGDGLINGADLGVLLASWGPCQSTITSITPNQGCIVGGTQINITGTYLGSTSAVTIGGTPATSFTVVSQNTVQATTPAGAAGPANVRVTTAAGTITASQQFTYMPASVSSIVPNQGIVAGGTQITITGAYLGLTTSITIGGSPCTSVTVVNATTITAVTPVGMVGNADVGITGGKGAITVPGGFRYFAASVPSWATLVESEPDPTVVTDPSLRAAITATGMAWRVRDTVTGIEMLLIPPGTFQMGCIMGSNQYACGNNPSSLPVHQVTLTNSFYLGRFEVTQAQWQQQMGSNPSHWWGSDRPVETVSWNTTQIYLGVTGLRLPTEAEWEFACRAGTQTPFYNGSTDDSTVGDLAWYDGNAGWPMPVGGKLANALGLHDMLGNVWEWTSDCWGEYSAEAQTNPAGGTSCGVRMIRGGCWQDPGLGSRLVRSYFRGFCGLDCAGDNIGFRVARNP